MECGRVDGVREEKFERKKHFRILLKTIKKTLKDNERNFILGNFDFCNFDKI